MKLNLKIYRNKIDKCYFHIDGYDYRDDKLLSYQEAVLIDWVMNHPDQKFVETSELDSIGVYSRIWWEDCIGRLYRCAIIDTPWNKVLKDKNKYYLKDTVYDENGNRIPWQKLKRYKGIIEFANEYLGGMKIWK